MHEGLTTASLRKGIKNIAANAETLGNELNRMDGQLGDGDIGVTVVRGIRGMADEASSLPDDVGMALLKCAQVFTKVSGSTFGTLLGTGLMSAAKQTKGRTEVPWSEISSLLGDALNAMSQRGKGELGDKTVLDAVEAARAAAAGIDAPVQILTAVNTAIAKAIERFRNKRSMQGRARIFGDKSVGIDDPGMVAFQRIVKCLG